MRSLQSSWMVELSWSRQNYLISLVSVRLDQFWERPSSVSSYSRMTAHLWTDLLQEDSAKGNCRLSASVLSSAFAFSAKARGLHGISPIGLCEFAKSCVNQATSCDLMQSPLWYLPLRLDGVARLLWTDLYMIDIYRLNMIIYYIYNILYCIHYTLHPVSIPQLSCSYKPVNVASLTVAPYG